MSIIACIYLIWLVVFSLHITAWQNCLKTKVNIEQVSNAWKWGWDWLFDHNQYYPKGIKLAWANHQSIRVKHFNCCPLHPRINKMFPSSGFQVAQTKFNLISANNHLSNVLSLNVWICLKYKLKPLYDVLYYLGFLSMQN